MKKIILQSFIVFSLFQSIEMNAQLTVKGASSFVYVGDEVLFVNKDVNLDDGKIYLRREGQLLQGNKPSSTNKGTGSGAVSSYIMSLPTNQYNYTHYGIPVSSTVSTSPVSTSNFVVSDKSIGGPNSVTGMTGVSFTGNGSLANDGRATINGGIVISRPFVSWYGGTGGYSTWKFPFTNGQNSIPAGYGFYMKGTGGQDSFEPTGESAANKASADAAQRFDFRGVPNDGGISIDVVAGGQYALGNPYPSGFNLNKFMYDNAAIIDNVSFYVEIDKGTHLLVLLRQSEPKEQLNVLCFQKNQENAF